MTVGCPSCGAPVEFRYDDSFVRVCEHCRSAVVRTDRGVETLGKFADLMPIQSPLRLFAEGRHGTTGFQLIGMAQLRHSAGGVWQEWYARLDASPSVGQWAWLSEAQGRLYLTFERPDVAAPPLAPGPALAPGAPVVLAGTTFTVSERGMATYVSAAGEIPYRLVPNTTFHFVDLSDGRGGFATIDYGDGSEPPAVYLGYQVTPEGLGLSGGEAPQPAPAAAAGARLACPNCNGSLELRAPDQSLRVVCPYCNHLVSVEGGTLSIIAKLANKPRPALALGSRGTFIEGELTVIGFVQRSAYVDGSWWPFEEYLLYAPAVGFRWLVRSDGHWSYVQPVAAGAVTEGDGSIAGRGPRDTLARGNPRGMTAGIDAEYDGVKFRRFQVAELRVDAVLGELYWRVQAGERVSSVDFIAPPAMLSVESTPAEQNWSLATYLPVKDVERAFGRSLALAAPTGVAPNQPYPAGVGKVMALVTALMFAVGIGKCASAPNEAKLHQRFAFPPSGKRATVDPTLGVVPSSGSGSAAGSAAGDPAGDPAGTVAFSDEFHLDGGHNLAFDLSAGLSNNWLYAAIDLINKDTGGVVSFDANLEYYSGYDADGSWSEGSTTASQVLGPVEAGTYQIRVEGQHGGTGDVLLTVGLRQGVFRWTWFGVFLGVLAIPFGAVALHAVSFRKRRWQNSNLGGSLGGSGGDDDDD
ncbi:MAG TPA: DUF4178 domain-containing protein [Kofleriaceae bacterium]|nr:DUF4178 domain-containing protein [Kofleriaceae bacterium]